MDLKERPAIIACGENLIRKEVPFTIAAPFLKINKLLPVKTPCYLVIQ
jgi:hypothetical protein